MALRGITPPPPLSRRKHSKLLKQIGSKFASSNVHSISPQVVKKMWRNIVKTPLPLGVEHML